MVCISLNHLDRNDKPRIERLRMLYRSAPDAVLVTVPPARRDILEAEGIPNNELWQAYEDEKEALDATRDADAIAELFSGDAVLHVANMSPIGGRVAIRAFYQNMFGFLSASNALSERTEVSGSGDMAYEVGRTSNEFRGPEGPVSYEGRYVLVWRRLDGEWMIAYYGVSSNEAQAAR